MLNDLGSSFALWADAKIEYNGRACSTLKRGVYLIIYKNDGAFLVHGADQVAPRNYMSSGASLTIDGNNILVQRKNEKISIYVYQAINHYCPEQWSHDKIELTRTERDLVNKLAADPIRYFGIMPADIDLEWQTPEGPVDLVCWMAPREEENNEAHVVEVKRNKITKSACRQLEKYLPSFNNAVSYVAAPTIGASALKYCTDSDILYVEVKHD